MLVSYKTLALSKRDYPFYPAGEDCNALLTTTDKGEIATLPLVVRHDIHFIVIAGNRAA